MTSGINIKQILTYFFLNPNKCSSIICSSFPFCHLLSFLILDFSQKGLPQDFHDFHSFVVLYFYSATREALQSKNIIFSVYQLCSGWPILRFVSFFKNDLICPFFKKCLSSSIWLNSLLLYLIEFSFTRH